MRFSLWISFLWSGVYCIGRQYLFQLPLSFICLVKAQGCFVARRWGLETGGWTISNHPTNIYTSYWSSTRGQFCKKGLLCNKSPTCNYLESKWLWCQLIAFKSTLNIRLLTSHQQNAGLTQWMKAELGTFMLPEVTDIHSSSFSPLHHAMENLEEIKWVYTVYVVWR